MYLPLLHVLLTTINNYPLVIYNYSFYSGVVYTCGLNDAHQLGQTPKNPGPILPVSLAPFYLRLLRGLSIIAIGAGRYHTAVCTEREVYTFGKNLGQLGYAKSTETQIQPKIVRTIGGWVWLIEQWVWLIVL